MSDSRPLAAPTALVLCGIASTQTGGAIAKTLFDRSGPGGTAFLRVAFAAAILLALWRPSPRGRRAGEVAVAAAFGLTLGGMNLSFYEALARLPLGIAVTIEFVGPLAVAVAGSRRALDAVWVVLAAAGVILLARGGGHVSALGVGLALLAGGFWAAYIVLSARVGAVFPGGGGLAIAMTVAAVALVPAGIAASPARLANAGVLAAAAGVALLSSAIPYSLELDALRRLPKRVFGILMSLEPAVAAVAGLVVLGEQLRARDAVAIALVVAASAGASLSTGEQRPPDA